VDNPKIIYRYKGPINKSRQYDLMRKKQRRLKKEWNKETGKFKGF
tara:strand:+ start:370 stop:504 length:135 start_codon:yes stop_codon:yes gene_type:complete